MGACRVFLVKVEFLEVALGLRKKWLLVMRVGQVLKNHQKIAQ